MNQKTILYDAMAIRPDPAGVGYVQQRILNEASKSDNFKFVAYTRQGVHKIDGLNNKNVTIHYTNYPFYYFGWKRFYFEQFRLTKIIDKYLPDIIHFTTGFGTPILYRKKSTKIVLTVHDLIPLGPYSELMTKVDMVFYKKTLYDSIEKADKIVCISEKAKTDINKYFPEKNNIEIISNGVDEILKPKDSENIWTQFKEKYQIDNDIMLYIGGFAPRKNVFSIVKSYHWLLVNKNIKTQLVLSGRFSQTKDIREQIQTIQKYIKQNNLSKNIILIDYMSQDIKNTLLYKAKLLIYISNAEGFGIPVLEGLICGTPVLTSDIAPLNTIGLGYATLCNQGSIQDISNKIYATLTNYQKEKTSIKSAKAEILSKYNWAKIGKQYRQIYQKLN